MWKRKRKKEQGQSARFLNEKAEKLAVSFIEMQRKLADRLNEKVKGTSKQVLQKWLIVYCLLATGATLKLRLMEPIRLVDKTIPAGTTIYGTTAFMQTRLKIEVTSVLYDGKLFPVNLTAIATDGIEGLPVQSAELHKEAGRLTDDISGQLLLQSGGALGTELASAGVKAARSLFSKKMKSVSIKLPSGYQLLLKNKG